jgi:hypothetical protein
MSQDSYIWATQDGRSLDIRWMDSKHLVRSFNMLIRRNNMSVRAAERQDTMFFAAMRSELKSRGLWKWEGNQIVIDPVSRETFKIMCMLRAMLDTNIVWPPGREMIAVVTKLRIEGEAFINKVMQAMHHDPHPDWYRLVTKFTEYRLAPPVNGS